MTKRILWGLVYVAVFAVVFVGSAMAKLLIPSALDQLIRVAWDETVGTCYTDLAYGDGAFQKFDLYVPADRSKRTYGLVIYLHAGGFNAGDKRDDAAMCRFFASRGYVAAAVNYTLNTAERPSNIDEMSQDVKRSVPAIRTQERSSATNSIAWPFRAVRRAAASR